MLRFFNLRRSSGSRAWKGCKVAGKCADMAMAGWRMAWRFAPSYVFPSAGIPSSPLATKHPSISTHGLATRK